MRLSSRIGRLETRRAAVRGEACYQILLFDAATGLPLPGYEPRSDVPGYIWLPAKEPLPDPWGGREEGAGKAKGTSGATIGATDTRAMYESVKRNDTE